MLTALGWIVVIIVSVVVFLLACAIYLLIVGGIILPDSFPADQPNAAEMNALLQSGRLWDRLMLICHLIQNEESRSNLPNPWRLD